jgi:hypothetical protein
MSIEIVESYHDIRPFAFIRSMSYEQFRPYSLRWDNEQERKELYTRIRKMCDEVIRAKGTITRAYHHSFTTPAGLGGRLFGPSSIQAVPREIRGMLMKHTTDIDMANAHPVILRHLCRKYGIKHVELDYYINHRDELIGSGEDRDAKKALYLKALNKDKIVPEVKDFSKEMLTIQKQLMTIPEFSGIAETVEGKKWNKSGSYLNKCLCIYENNILQCVKDYLVSNGHTIRCLAFDGLMIDGNHYENTQLISDIQQAVNSKFENLDIKFTYKPHDTSIVIPQNFNEHVKNENNDEYLEWKTEFELTHAKIIDRSSFIKSVKDKNGFIIEVRSMTKRDLLISYEHISYNEPKETKTGMTTVKKSCIQRWISDDTMSTYDEIGVYPPPLVCPPTHFNIWTPFYAEMLPLSSTVKMTPEVLETYTQKKELILQHISILCNNDEADTLFLKKWIGQMLKYPAIKTVAPTLISQQGAGKGALMYLLQRMIGANKFLETTDPAKYVWGNFNELMVNKFLVNCDEMNYKDQNECEGKIKGLITNNNLTINPKGVKSFTIQSYHRFILTTNNEVPVKTDKDDRRNKIIRCSDEKIGDAQYFIDLREAIEDDHVVRMVFEYLTSIDGLDVFHTERIQQNEYQKTLSEATVSIPERFMRHLTATYLNIEEKTFTAEDILCFFIAWRDRNKFVYECDSSKLMRNLKLLKLCPNWYSTVKGRTCNTTSFDFAALKEHFNMGIDPSLVDACETDDEQ